MSTECLAALLKDFEDIHSLGQLLRINKDTISAIDSYYDDARTKISHVVNLWLMDDPGNPVTLLRKSLVQLGKESVSETLITLTSLGKLMYFV